MTLFEEPLLSARDERELARAIELGVVAHALLEGEPGLLPCVPASPEELRRLQREGREAHARFVRANLRLVAGIAYREAGRLGLPREELFQEGVVGLLEALRRWDWRRELRFSTYAVSWVRSAVAQAAALRCGEVHVGARSAATLQAVRKAARELEGAGQRPTPSSVGVAAGVGERSAATWLAYASPCFLSDELAARIAAPEAAQDADDEARALGVMLAGLADPARRIVRLRYGFDGPRRTQEETAAMLGCSVRHVQRWEARALAELRAGAALLASAA